MTQPLTAFTSNTPAGEARVDAALLPRPPAMLAQIGLGLWISSGMVIGAVVGLGLRFRTFGETMSLCGYARSVA